MSIPPVVSSVVSGALSLVASHPALLLLVLPAVPGLLGKLEKAAIARLLAAGDAADQKLLRAVTLALVVWAEDKGHADGAAKFAAVDKVLARALPFLSADQRKDLIEKAVAELDSQAHAAIEEAAKKPS